MVDELECAASVLLAILFGHLLGAHNISWAAFSGYMVMRGHVSESLRRGALRVAGTVVGAAVAVALIQLFGTGPLRAAAALALVGGVTLYAALTARHSYAWLFVGLTFSMVLLDQTEHPEHGLRAFVTTRVLEVVAGTSACVLVSMVSTLSLRRRWPGTRRPRPGSVGWHPRAARHAGQGAAALALLPLLAQQWRLPQLGQAAVAIMAVMMVPVSSIGLSGFWPVTRRILLRVTGCACGAALAAAILFLAHGSAAVLIAGTVLGVMLGRHIENGETSLAYAGTQFTLAVLVTLVPDSYAEVDPGAGWERLMGTLLGIALLEPVLLAWHAAAPPGAAPGSATRKEPGDI